MLLLICVCYSCHVTRLIWLAEFKPILPCGLQADKWKAISACGTFEQHDGGNCA